MNCGRIAVECANCGCGECGGISGYWGAIACTWNGFDPALNGFDPAFPSNGILSCADALAQYENSYDGCDYWEEMGADCSQCSDCPTGWIGDWDGGDGNCEYWCYGSDGSGPYCQDKDWCGGCHECRPSCWDSCHEDAHTSWEEKCNWRDENWNQMCGGCHECGAGGWGGYDRDPHEGPVFPPLVSVIGSSVFAFASVFVPAALSGAGPALGLR